MANREQIDREMAVIQEIVSLMDPLGHWARARIWEYVKQLYLDEAAHAAMSHQEDDSDA